MLEPTADEQAPPRWMCTMPLVHDDRLQAVVALYASASSPFTDQQAQLLELLAPRLAATFASLGTRHTAADPVDGMAARRGSDLRIVRRGA
jgi:hypothetical protein